MEFSLANLPSVELCIRRAVSKSQTEVMGTTGPNPFSEEARGREQARSFFKVSILVEQDLEKCREKKNFPRKTFKTRQFKAF